MFRIVFIFSLVASLALGNDPLLRLSIVDGRIVGGKDTTIENHPYQVSFQFLKSHQCGGSLVAPNIVVTAAHCTGIGQVKNMAVRAGSTHHNGGGLVIKVESVHNHPKYNPGSSHDYDVAVLVLKGSFELSNAIQLIPLQPVNVEVPTGKLATVTGWGALSSGGAYPLILQAVDVPKIDQKTCQTIYPDENVSERMHCFGYKEGGKDACKKDSGGPLAVDGKLAGIVSWGHGCGLENEAGVYAKVSNQEIADHIKDILNKHGDVL